MRNLSIGGRRAAFTARDRMDFLLEFARVQARACAFGALLLTLMLLTHLWYPPGWPHRYDLLFATALAFQVFLVLSKRESGRETLVIVLFHLLATAMEVFKTSEAVGAWRYPEEFVLGVGNVPLFAGFMYGAVGSYLARIWCRFDFRFSGWPAAAPTLLAAAAIYANFFTHHYMADLRIALLLWVAVLFRRTRVYYRIGPRRHSMPLLLGWLLVAFFIWLAENLATLAHVWIYPGQEAGWRLVAPGKLPAWFLLMIVSFVLVALVKTPRKLNGQACRG